ncbi:MAG: hypothetical protein M3Q58_05525 [Bacteroidota bacterium]|nr:hypothetical protein [Bacteroidota bacterium]
MKIEMSLWNIKPFYLIVILISTVVSCHSPDLNQVIKETYWEDSGNIKEEVFLDSINKLKIIKSYYSNGQLKSEEKLLNDKKEGVSKAWYSNGNSWYNYNYQNDSLIGMYLEWYENGNFKLKAKITGYSFVPDTNLKEEISYFTLLDGNYIYYNENGKIKSLVSIRNGKATYH